MYAAGHDAPLAKGDILVKVNEPVASDGADVQFAQFSDTLKKVRSSYNTVTSVYVDINRHHHQRWRSNEL